MVQLKTLRTINNISSILFLTVKIKNQFEYLQTHNIILNNNKN